jgi:iron complex outermembrane receptor protein
VGGVAAFSTAAEPLRCALGLQAACAPAPIALITSPNPGLAPERSRSYTLGAIWDPLPRVSVSADLWRIERKNEINQEAIPAAIAAGKVARDPSTAQAGIPGDPGAIVAVLANYVNSARSDVRGVDLDGRAGMTLPGTWGSLSGDVKWTHFFRWVRTEQDGSARDFAGTHGNCDVTNCAGTPNNRINLTASWERGPARVSATANFRGRMRNTLFRGDPGGCASIFANGTDAPAGCEIASFTTVDLAARYQVNRQVAVFASIQNLADKVPPLDPLTYGAAGYNPLDYEGALGRFFNVGLRYTY